MSVREGGGLSLGRFFGVVAVAFGMGLAGAALLDMHSHTCSCGHRWKHFGMFSYGDAYAHACPSCGSMQWWREGEATARSNIRADDILGGRHKSMKTLQPYSVTASPDGAPPANTPLTPLDVTLPGSPLLPNKTG